MRKIALPHFCYFHHQHTTNNNMLSLASTFSSQLPRVVENSGDEKFLITRDYNDTEREMENYDIMWKNIIILHNVKIVMTVVILFFIFHTKNNKTSRLCVTNEIFD
jgi:hypothetical protein